MSRRAESEAGQSERAAKRSESALRRVLIISHDFPPSTEVGAQACAQIARYLPLHGWEPVVLTARGRDVERRDGCADPGFPRVVVRTGLIPHPVTLYRSLKSVFRPSSREAASDGASLVQRGAMRRWILSLLTVPDACTGWILPAVIAGLSVIQKQGVEYLFSSGPYWTNHLVGLALRWLTGLPWTAHFRDPWAHGRYWEPTSALSARIETALERMVVTRANAVVCVTERHTALLRQTYARLPSRKFVTVPNGFDGAEWDALEEQADGARAIERDKFVIIYAGSLYHRRTPRPLFRALRALIDSGDIDRERIRVELIGDCESTEEGESVREMAAACGLADRVSIVGTLDRTETLRRMSRSNLLMVLAEGWTLQIPAKTYEYLRAGRPILALTSEGALADLLRKTGEAWVVDPADETGVAAAVGTVFRRWTHGLNGRTPDPAVVSGFDRRVLAGRFAEVFETSAGRMGA